MVMMRRGPLDRYSPEWVLRQAHAHQVDGSIAFHTERPVTVHLDGGRIHAIVAGIDGHGDDVEPAPRPEAELRDEAVALLADLLGLADGWYYHDPLDRHPSRGDWAWEPATLLAEAQSRPGSAARPVLPPPLAAPAPPAATPPPERTVALQRSSTAVTLGVDAWALVVALAGTATTTELSERLGWDPERVRSTVAEIEPWGVLGPEPAGRSREVDPAPAPPATSLRTPSGVPAVPPPAGERPPHPASRRPPGHETLSAADLSVANNVIALGPLSAGRLTSGSGRRARRTRRSSTG